LFYLGGLFNPANYGNLAGKTMQATFYNGRNSPDNSDKKSISGLNLYWNFPAGGQKFGIANNVSCAGSGDCFTQSNGVYYSGYSTAPGDEGVSGNSNQIIQTSDLIQPIITTKTVSSCAATSLNQAVTKNADAGTPPQTVAVLPSATGCAAGDWITIGYGAIGSPAAYNEEIVQLTGAGSGTITAVFQSDHASGAPVGPATVLAYASMVAGGANGPATDKVWVDIDAAASTVTGTITGISGGTVTGSGTSWSNTMVGGTANSVGCMSFPVDTVTVAPFYNSTRRLVSWYPIQSVTDGTHLVLQGYTGVAAAGNKFVIKPCAVQHETALSYGTTSETVTGVVLAYNTFAWTVGHQIEATISPFSSVNHGELVAMWQTGPGSNLGSQYVGVNIGYQPVQGFLQTEQSGLDGALWHPIYTSGITATGSTGQTCLLDSFNGGGTGASAFIELTGTNTIASGQVIYVTQPGAHYGAITSATASSGTATCSGTATLTSTPSYSYKYGWQQAAWTGSGVIAASGKDQTGTLIGATTYVGDPKAITWSGAGGSGFLAPSGSTLGQLDMGSSASKIHWTDDPSHPSFGALWDFSAPIAAFNNVTLTIPNSSGVLCLDSTGCSFPGILTRSIPNNVNDTIEIGNYGPDFNSQFSCYQVSAGYEQQAKMWEFCSHFAYTGTSWNYVVPVSYTPSNSGDDFALDVLSSSSTGRTYLRLRRTLSGGAYALSVRVSLNQTVGKSSDVFTATSATATGVTPPTASFPTAVITQSDNKLGIVNATNFVASIDPTNLTANRTFTLPNAPGTFALTTNTARNYGGAFGTPGGATLSTGLISYTQPIAAACTITGFDIEVDTGTATVKFWKVAAGTALPDVGNSISTSGVAISTGTVLHSTTTSDFTTLAVAANDVIAMTNTATSGAGFIQATVRCQ